MMGVEKKQLIRLTWYMLILLTVNYLWGCEKGLPEPGSGIHLQPENTVVFVGESAVFKVEMYGKEDFKYQWIKNGVPVSGAIENVLKVPSVVLSDNETEFYVVVSFGEEKIISKTVKLFVKKQESAIVFSTLGSSFSPIIEVTGNPIIEWAWSDGTTSNSISPSKKFSGTGLREQTLKVTPWSALKSIIIGYDASDGGAELIPFVEDQQVVKVRGLDLVSQSLEIWCSSYNQIDSLDFTGFAKLHTIECYNSQTLRSIKLENTTSLKRLCIEDCSVENIDLSGCPSIQDIRGALNNFPVFFLGNSGSLFKHICIRDNPQIVQQNLFENMSKIPQISELWIWNTNQTGKMIVPSSSKLSDISFICDNNKYTSADFTGSMQNENYTAELSFINNEIAHFNISGCKQISKLVLKNNSLSVLEVNTILSTLDGLGRNVFNTPEQYNLILDISGNAMPDEVGYTAAKNLASKGWKIITTGWVMEPNPIANIGEAKIEFSTVGDSTSMSCSFVDSPEITWHWSDGSTSRSFSGEYITKKGLGTGEHLHYFTISNGAALTRFGAAIGGGKGNLVSFSDFENVPNLKLIYAFYEKYLIKIGRSNHTQVNDYHLYGTSLAPEAIDQLINDVVNSGVKNGTLWIPNSGTSSSDADKIILTNRGWQF